MTKTNVNVGGKVPSINFHASVKTWTAPKIEETFMDDEGRETYILANGHTQLAEGYNALWNPTRHTPNMDKKYKGEGLDGRTNWIK